MNAGVGGNHTEHPRVRFDEHVLDQDRGIV
jgi:hypothetical protein